MFSTSKSEPVVDTTLYNAEGYLHIPDFFTAELVDSWNKAIDNLVLNPDEITFDESGTGKIKQIQYLHQRHLIFQELVETLRPVAQQLTGQESLSVLNVQLFEKHPDISKPTRSHQDNAYFKVSPALALTFWIPLDFIDEENGCLYYAPKTHLTPTRKHQRYHEQTTFRVRSGVPGLSLCLKEHPEETDIAMMAAPGDLFVHHCDLIHRAGKNSSIDRRRRAIGVVFIPKVCEADERLMGYHLAQLREDIELQEVKNPELYRKLKADYQELFEN